MFLSLACTSILKTLLCFPLNCRCQVKSDACLHSFPQHDWSEREGSECALKLIKGHLQALLVGLLAGQLVDGIHGHVLYAAKYIRCSNGGGGRVVAWVGDGEGWNIRDALSMYRCIWQGLNFVLEGFKPVGNDRSALKADVSLNWDLSRNEGKDGQFH